MGNTEDICHSFCPLCILLPLPQNRKERTSLELLSVHGAVPGIGCVWVQVRTYKSGKKIDSLVPDCSFVQFSFLSPIFFLPFTFQMPQLAAPFSLSRNLSTFSRESQYVYSILTGNGTSFSFWNTGNHVLFLFLLLNIHIMFAFSFKFIQIHHRKKNYLQWTYIEGTNSFLLITKLKNKKLQKRKSV